MLSTVIINTCISLIVWFLLSIACITVTLKKLKPTWKTRITLSLLATAMAAILQFIIGRICRDEDIMFASFFATIFICLMIVVQAYKKKAAAK